MFRASSLLPRFRLSSGEWVDSDEVAADVLDATAPLVSMVHVVGAARADVRLILAVRDRPCREYLCAQLAQPSFDGNPETHGLLYDRIAQDLYRLNQRHRGAAREIARFMLVPEPSGGDVDGSVAPTIRSFGRPIDEEVLYAG